MSKYVCLVCGYVYDPLIGDASAGIAPGTPFEELPDDWVCPECGAGKEMFEPLGSQASAELAKVTENVVVAAVSQPEEARSEKYECLACGYVYDPLAGDVLAGIAPGTLFAELPDDWVCPECGAGKEMFALLE